MEVVVIPENVIVTGSGGSLDSFMRHQVEVSFSWMIDPLVNNSSSESIIIIVLVGICMEESGVVSLLNNNKSDWRLVIFLNLLASFPDGHLLIGQNQAQVLDPYLNFVADSLWGLLGRISSITP